MEKQIDLDRLHLYILDFAELSWKVHRILYPDSKEYRNPFDQLIMDFVYLVSVPELLQNKVFTERLCIRLAELYIQYNQLLSANPNHIITD